MTNLSDDAYGGFIVSKNVIVGRPIGYSFRERAAQPQLNGWTLYSVDDDDQYVNDPANFVIVGVTTLHARSPVMLELFDAPYGTDLQRQYTQGLLTGFWDLAGDQTVSIDQLLRG